MPPASSARGGLPMMILATWFQAIHQSVTNWTKLACNILVLRPAIFDCSFGGGRCHVEVALSWTTFVRGASDSAQQVAPRASLDTELRNIAGSDATTARPSPSENREKRAQANLLTLCGRHRDNAAPGSVVACRADRICRSGDDHDVWPFPVRSSARPSAGRSMRCDDRR